MKYHRADPTANAAIGAADRELKQKRREAERLRALLQSGQLTPEMEEQARRRFTGIFKPILEKALKI